MTKLSCYVVSCSTNKDGCCCRPKIIVNGDHAQTCTDTCCSSYTYESEAVVNAISFLEPNRSVEIDCDACDCLHNKSHRCTARSIEINCHNCGGTECAAFKKARN